MTARRGETAVPDRDRHRLMVFARRTPAERDRAGQFPRRDRAA